MNAEVEQFNYDERKRAALHIPVVCHKIMPSVLKYTIVFSHSVYTIPAAARVRPCATVRCESRQVRKEAAISILPVCRSKPFTGWSRKTAVIG